MWTSGHYGYLSDYVIWWVVPGSLLLHTWCFFRLWPARRRPNWRLVVGNALITLGGLALAGLAAETYLRFLCVKTDSFGTTLTCKRWFHLYPRANSWLCRDKEWTTPKPADLYRVAFVGDSFTYGWGVNEEKDLFTSRLQARFDQRPRPDRSAPHVEVMNVAWRGWNTGDEVTAIPTLIRDYAVDEVVLCYLPNDIEPLIPTTEDFDPARPPRPTYFRGDCSFLLDFLFHRLYARRLPGVRGYFDWLADGYADPQVWPRQVELLQRIIGICADEGVRLRVVLLPFLKTGGQRFSAEAIHGQVARVFTDAGVEVLDLLPTIAPLNANDLIVNSADYHPNEQAHALFADAIWQTFYAAR
ncbi:MAG TPA: SGNH/GDSL hydrolase family protein [Phycisphaerae bacterium]|nr:SGNH/GDSL hydrolase family protein [Phycisphaerae bacterium]HNU47115.1 SGNH/GDSL hydrolase family protein [Phycisphaerae bacterium]